MGGEAVLYIGDGREIKDKEYVEEEERRVNCGCR